MPFHSDLPKSKKEAVGYILKKIGGMLKGPKARRLDDRRKADKGIEQRAGSNGHKLMERTPGGWVQGKRFRKDRRRGSKFNIEKRKAKDLGKLALKITPPTVAAATAAGVYNRKNKEKKNGKVEEEPDYTKGGTLKLRELTPDEIRDKFHTNTERIKKSQKTSIPQSTYAKGMKRVKDQIKSSKKRSDYHYSEGREHYGDTPAGRHLDSITGESPKKRELHRKLSTAYAKKSKGLRKFVEADKKFR